MQGKTVEGNEDKVPDPGAGAIRRLACYRPRTAIERAGIACLTTGARLFTKDRSLTETLSTTSIYFEACLQDLIGAPGEADKPVWRITPNAFYFPGPNPKALIIRNFTTTVRALFEPLPKPEFRFLVDDDINAALTDRRQPFAYRARLLASASDTADHLEREVSTVYISHPRIGAIYSDFRTVAIRPVLITPTADLDHHCQRETLRLIFPGTRSHLADLRSIAADVARFMRATPQAGLDLFLGKFSPRDLALPNVCVHDPLPWKHYRQLYETRRYHIALVPGLPTAFNASRSFNKILEAAYFGAAPIYSETVSFRDHVGDTGLICKTEPGSWYDALQRLYADPALTQELARKTVSLAQSLGDSPTARAFWLNEFNLNAPAR